MTIDERLPKAQARQLLLKLEKQGIKITYAMQDLETKSRLYNIFYEYPMTEPSITYASE